MKNAGLTIGMCAIGLGLASIGFNSNGNQAIAFPARTAPKSEQGFVGITAFEGKIIALGSSGRLYEASLARSPNHPDVQPWANARNKLTQELAGRLSTRERREKEAKLRDIEAGLLSAMGVDGWVLRLDPPQE